MADAPEIVIVGGGGHARVLIDALRAAGETRTIGVLDADRARIGTSVFGVPIVGDDAILPDLADSGTRYFAVGIGGTGDNAPRARLFEKAVSLGLQPLTIVHPRAVVSVFSVVGAGCQILAGAIVGPGVTLGCNVIVNTAAVVEHDCVIGDHTHIATGARLASTVRIGDRAHVGVAATVRQVITIGAASVVGAGAVVVKDVSPGTVVIGVPAKEITH